MSKSKKSLVYEVLATQKGKNGLYKETRKIVFENELDSKWIQKKGLIKAADVIASNTKIGVSLEYTPYIESKIYNSKSDMVYAIVINGKIVKIGKTETGLCGRWGSYQNGGAERRKKKGNGSVTNHYVMMAIKSAIDNGLSVEWYIKYMDKKSKEINILGQKCTESVFTNGNCDTWEKILLSLYEKQNGQYPTLCNNA